MIKALKKLSLIFWSVFIFGFITTLPNSYAQGDNFSSEEFKEWSNLLLEKKHRELILALEKELLEESPNEMAKIVWLQTHINLENLDSAYENLSVPLKNKLYSIVDIYKTSSIDLPKKYPLKKVNQLKSWAEIYQLLLKADNDIDSHYSYEIAKRALSLYPNSFDMLLAISNEVYSVPESRKEFITEYNNGQFNHSPSFQNYAEVYLIKLPSGHYDSLKGIDDFLKQFPHDATAWRIKGSRHYSLEQYELSINAFETAFQLDPLTRNGMYSLLGLAKSNAKLYKYTEVEETSILLANLYNPNDSEAYKYYYWAKSLRETGDRGSARKVIEKATSAIAEHPVLQLEYGQLEIQDKRYEHAIPKLQKAAQLDPANLMYQKTLIEAFKESGRLDDALENYLILSNSHNQLTESLYVLGSEIYDELEEHQLSIEILESAIALYPHSDWLYRQMAFVYKNANMIDDAINSLQFSFQYYHPYRWSMSMLTDLFNKKYLNDEVKVAEQLNELLYEFPWVEDIWEAMANEKNDYEEKISLWLRAKDRNPGKIYPLVQLRYLYSEKEAWAKIDKMYEDASAKITQLGGDGDKIKLHFEKAIATILKLRTAPITSEELESAHNSLNTYLKSGGYAGAFYQFTSELYYAAGNLAKAKEYFGKQFDYRPDSDPTALITKYNAISEGYERLTRYAERAPYDKNRLRRLVDTHVKYPGSPIAALIYSEEYTDRFGSRLETLEAMAFGALGDHAKEFETLYQNDNALAASYRYVRWYNISRKKVWSGSADVKIDAENQEATITMPNGVVIKRRDNIRFGKINRLQIGPVYISADYDEKGNLISVESSSGRKIDLQYDAEGLISQITDQDNDKDEVTLEFKYNQMGKPIVIFMHGVGSINVEYGKTGDIRGVQSDRGPQIALKVTRSFENLLALTKKFERFNSVNNLKVPDLGVKDKEYEALYEEFNLKDYELSNSLEIEDELFSVWIETAIKLCRYMYDNISADENYGANILQITARTINKAVKLQNFSNFSNRNQVLAAARLYYDTLNKIRYYGVDEKTWEEWVQITDWLELEKLSEKELTSYRRNIENLQNYISDNPIQLLSDTTWLPKSFIQNSGFWKRYGFEDLVPTHLHEGLILNSSFHRKNGEVIVGTNKGISILRKGYWEWMGFNDLQRSFQQDLPKRKIGGSSYITSLAETSNGDLFVGTLNGLIRVERSYEESGHTRYTELDGLPGKNVTHLAALGDAIIIGTDNGAVYLKDGKISTIAGIQSSKIKTLISKTYKSSTSDHTVILLGTEEGLYLAKIISENTPLSFSKIYANSGADATLGNDQFVYLLNGKELYRLYPQGSNELHTPMKLSGSVLTSVADNVFGLASVPITSNEDAIAVMTDYGMSLYHKKRFEHFRLPLSDQNSWAKNVSRSIDGNAMTVITEQGLLVFQNRDVIRLNRQIYDLLTVDALGMTFVADGSNLKYILSDDSNETIRELTDFTNYGNTTHLAVDNQNRLILNDGRMLHRLTFDPNTKALLNNEELFYCEQTEVEGYKAGDITSIIVSKDGTLWVTAGLSLFRYQDKSAEAEEFNFFLDSHRFPSRSYHIDKVIETIDNRILVVASDEGHLYYNGIVMEGGLLEWDPQRNRFLRTTDNYKERGFNFFITGYTPISDELAIVGTLGGFAEDQHGNIKDYSKLGGGVVNLSYESIFKGHRSLFSGTKGARLGDVWLFGSAAGVLVYQDGNWFFPERFNQMLPDDMELSKYGSRHVNAISTDINGKIYVGTARGLAVFDFHGEDPMSFLFHYIDPARAFMHQNMDILQSERDIVISSIPEDSETGKLLKNIEKQEQEIKNVSRKLAIRQQAKIRGPGNSIDIRKKNSLEEVLVTLESKKQRHAELLLTLQQEEPSIYQLVTLPPLDLLASRRRMKKNEAIVQYIPARKSLFIQVLAKDKVLLREVKVSRDILMSASKEVHALLAQDVGSSDPSAEVDIKERLSFLYDQLLKPIENEIKLFENIYVAPSQALYYVPFSALTKKISSNKYKYAVEDMNIGYVSSMYLFNLIYNFKPSTSQEILLMGDPDGSLPAARNEIETIEKIGINNFSLTKYLGFQSTSKNFKVSAPNSRIIHLATHGYLDNRSVKDSWILFADKKITMGEMFGLSMNNTELVTLSACQTGLGVDGMEYATLARAFTSAGAPTVLASLWEVEDNSANELFAKFYLFYSQGQSKFMALANAQRSMISSKNSDFNRTSRWSAVIPMGKH